jgi:hypothetical protein
VRSPHPEESDAAGKEIDLSDPRAIDILTTEHWSLLSTRSLGYQEMFARTTIFIAILSATVITLGLLLQATQFGREALWIALLMIAVDLFIGIATFVRSVRINLEDARCVIGMNLLRKAYLRVAPGVAPFFISTHALDTEVRGLHHGAPQRFANLRESLTTTSGTVATLNSILAGAIAGDIGAISGQHAGVSAVIGAVVSLVSGTLHVKYAAWFRQRHTPAGNS